ncbi:hypothetical protein BY996DRAFT_6558655 [Phakopsora pachyrhizi]|nr:hypothetical protein BY996DRAFT_6558655 [Phakopsora pachyrhizi]
MSASCVMPFTHSRAMLCFLMRSFMEKKLLHIVFIFPREVLSLRTSKEAQLSEFNEIFKSDNKEEVRGIKDTSTSYDVARAMYSAAHVEVATVGWCFDPHAAGWLLRVRMKPVSDLPNSPPQFASIHSSRVLVRGGVWDNALFRYPIKWMSAFQWEWSGLEAKPAKRLTEYAMSGSLCVSQKKYAAETSKPWIAHDLVSPIARRMQREKVEKQSIPTIWLKPCETKEQPMRVTTNIGNTPKLVGKRERAWAGWKPIIAGLTKQHKLDNGGRGKQPNKEAMGREGAGGLGEIVGRWAGGYRRRDGKGRFSGVRETPRRDRRRTDIRYISKAVVEKQSDRTVGPVGLWHWAVKVGRRARQWHTVVRSSYHFRGPKTLLTKRSHGELFGMESGVIVQHQLPFAILHDLQKKFDHDFGFEEGDLVLGGEGLCNLVGEEGCYKDPGVMTGVVQQPYVMINYDIRWAKDMSVLEKQGLVLLGHGVSGDLRGGEDICLPSWWRQTEVDWMSGWWLSLCWAERTCCLEVKDVTGAGMPMAMELRLGCGRQLPGLLDALAQKAVMSQTSAGERHLGKKTFQHQWDKDTNAA